jgi:DNA adenine methylase
LASRIEAGEPSAWKADLIPYFQTLAARLERTVLFHGDRKRTVTPAILKRGETAVFLDPPYDPSTCDSEEFYGSNVGTAWQECHLWSLDHQDDPGLRIALCGLRDGYNLPGWEEFAWKSSGGKHTDRGRERLWFSPS